MIHSCLVASSPGKICVLPILVVLEPLASLEVTGLDQTGLFVLVPLDSEEILWYLVQEVSLQFINFHGTVVPLPTLSLCSLKT